MTDPLIGRTIAQYEIVARIGGGAMGVVYKARDEKLGRLVALKFLPQAWSHDETAKQRFLREAQAASATNHPNICTIHDIERADDGQLFIVMAYYEGSTLKQRLESGPLPVDEALDIATQIADGLAKAHAQGVVHRDIKPGNIILTDDGVRILDFGLATFADALKLTSENSMLGTPAYMSPEQVRGQAADARSDVWAVGVVLYEMLTGHVPFQGAYAEAVAHAILHEAPEPLRSQRPDVSEEIEQLVFRALHKDASVRYPGGRELARALRQVRGLSVPLDLRTQPVTVSPVHEPPSRKKLWPRVATGVAIVALVIVAAVAWALQPVERVPVALVPVINQTGYPELDEYRFALTHALGSALLDSRTVRIVGHDQLLSILRRFRAKGRDASSSEALQAIKAHTGAQALVLVVYENRNDGSGFRARADFLNADTLTRDAAPFETPAEVSALVKETTYRLIPSIARGIESHFTARGSTRVRFANAVLGFLGRDAAPVLSAGSLDAAAEFEKGLSAYEELEYAAAMRSFVAATEYDRLNPLLFAWRSRVARLMRHDMDADELGRRATSLLTSQTPTRDRLFVEGVAAESRGELDTALARYDALGDRYRDDPAILLELAAFQDRQGRNMEAIATYSDVLARDARMVRPRLELCRMYNRINQPVNARDQARRAADDYGALEFEGGRAQALFCLTDSLRLGNEQERAEAVQHANAALQIADGARYPYNRSRAHNYLALALEAQGRLEDAVRQWEQALSGAREVGNVSLEPLVLMNLGATNEKLGNRVKAIEYLRQSRRGFEAIGDQSRAAESLFNVGVMLMSYGGDATEGLRNVRDALEVFRKLGNRNFEVHAAHAMSTYYRFAGRNTDAERELNRATSLASERDLDLRSATTAIHLAQSALDTGDYERALEQLATVLKGAPGRSQIEARIYLGRTDVRLGALEPAREMLETARQALAETKDVGLLAPMHVALGEWALESGRTADARKYFEAGAALLTSELPDIDAVEATAYLGLLDALEGREDAGRALIAQSLESARRIGHVSLVARCHVFLARLDLQHRRFAQALREIDLVPRDAEAVAIARELRAEVYYWSALAAAGSGNAARAKDDRAAARDVVQHLAASLQPSHRESFLTRRALADILK